MLRPGGQVVCAHWDWDSQTIEVRDKDLAHRMVHAFAELPQHWMKRADGWMGRRLWGHFESSGHFDGRVLARTLINTAFEPPWYGHARITGFAELVKPGVVTGAECTCFLEEVKTAAREQRYFYSITGYVYVGRAL